MNAAFPPSLFAFAIATLLHAIPARSGAATAPDAAAACIHVRDFGAIPDDSKCDLAAIRRAVAHARAVKAREIRFDPGVYDLDVKDPAKGVAIALYDFENLVFSGAVNPDGTPATTLLRSYQYAADMHANQIIRAARCKNIHIKNFALDNSPRYTTAGKVVEKDGDRIVMEIFEGNPAIDGCIFYCGNAWDLKTKTLKKVGSLTFGHDVMKNQEAYKVRLLPQASPDGLRRMELASAKVAEKLDVGDGVSWHFGFNGNQLNVTTSEDVFLENIYTYNAIGFCASVSRSRNIYAKNIVFKPRDNQLAVGSRDGLMLSCNRGKVVMDGLHVEGVRWDGQNAHAIFVWLRGRLDANTATFESKGGMAGRQTVEIPAGSRIGFYIGPDDERLLTVKTAALEKDASGAFYYKISFEETLPGELDSGSLACVYAWNMDDYTVKNSLFRNIAGCASLVRNRGAKIENCTYEYIMYPAVMIGPAIQEQEGPVTRDISVKNCRFIHCGWQTRHGTSAALGVKTQFWPGHVRPLMRNVKIEGNHFQDCDLGMQVEDVKGAKVTGNTFSNVAEKIITKNISDSVVDQ